MSRHRSGIYLIRNTKSKDKRDCYVGMSYQLDWRIAGHKRQIANGKHPNKKINKAIEDFGNDAFEITILEVCKSRWELPIRESRWYWKKKPRYNGEKRVRSDLDNYHDALEKIDRLKKENKKLKQKVLGLEVTRN